MLDQDLTELFELQAGEEPPPAHASIAAAAHHGRSWLRRRRTLTTAAPLLAAATVLGIALAGPLATQGPAHPRQDQPTPGPHVIPPLYFWPGWLPHGMTVKSGVVSARHGEWLNVRGTGAPLIAYSEGACTLKPSKLSCGPEATYALDGTARVINGYPAYWSDGSGLVFERARNQWASVAFPNREDDLRVARHLTARVPPIRYPAQLTGRWRGVGLEWAAFNYVHGRAVVHQYALARGADLYQLPGTIVADENALIDEHSAGAPRRCGQGTHEILGGYRVVVRAAGGPDPYSRVCASNADKLMIVVSTSGKRVFGPARAVFAHLKLFGPDPSNWPSTPFR